MATPSEFASRLQFKGICRLRHLPALQCAVLVAVLAWVSVIEAVRLESLGNANSWLQLQVGNWILAHRAVPHFGIFSQFSDLPWADPNWGVQVALAGLYRLFGMRAVPIAVMFLRMLLGLAIFILAGGRRGNFWLAVGISIWAQAAFLNSASLPATLCSAFLFASELVLLLRSREPGQHRLLYWSPLLILAWANLDWRFVLGVIAVCLFCATGALEQFLRSRNNFALSEGPPPAPVLLGSVAGATLITSLVSPNLYHSYVTAWRNLFGASLLENSFTTAFQTFREPKHYLLMSLALFAFLLLGRRHARDLFQLLLLVAGVSLGFALVSESWIIAVTSVAVIGEFFQHVDAQAGQSAQISGRVFRFAVPMAALILIVAATRIPSSPEPLLKLMNNDLPVQACDFVRKNYLPGPIYNELEWGSFLAWYLPEYPVAIDDRYELYGETRTKRYYGVMKGGIAPSSDSVFASANTIFVSTSEGIILGPEAFPNSEEMFRRMFSGFHEVYRDNRAVVLTRQP